jgi:glycosyltransferase involved in cell wall biosynthesis
VIRRNSIIQNGLTNFSAWLSKAGYRIYRVGLRAEALPWVFGRPLNFICRFAVHFVQKVCEAVLVLFIYPETGYDPIKQRLIDKRREIAGRLTGVTESELTRALRDLIEQNNSKSTSAGAAIVATDASAGRHRPVRPHPPGNMAPLESTDSRLGGRDADRPSPEWIRRSGTDTPDQGFGVVIPFYRHLAFLQDCLQSVATAAESLKNSELSVVIVNDDPEIGDGSLESRIPAELKPVTQVLGNKRNIGISRTLNRGIMASGQPWLLLLDCDDKIHPTCFEVLSHSIRDKPDASFLSSQMMLINDQDQFLGYHFRYRTVSDHAENLAASHLKVFRRGLFQEIGYHNPQYDGCQDYELALRTAIQKRIDLIPDFLYLYRWHSSNQGVSASARQNIQRKKISQVYRLMVSALTSGKSPVRIDGDGPFKDAWLKRLPQPTASTFLNVNLPFTSDWTLPRMIYLLADVLGVVYSRYLAGDHAPLTISLPPDYLGLCSTAYDASRIANSLHRSQILRDL